MIDKTTGLLSVDKPVIPASGAPPPRRRAQLYNSCAVNALLVMPAAFSVGIMLADPAEAQVTITSSSNISLSEYGPGPRNFVNSAGHQISGDQNAVYGDDIYVWTLSNAGTIVNQATAGGTGILFDSDGTIINTGSIIGMDGTVGNAGQYGIHITGAASVSNSGFVNGNTALDFADGGTLANLGQIEAYQFGISIAGTAGYVDNEHSGTTAGYISAGLDGILISSADGTAINAGTITADNLDSMAASGIYLKNGGSVSNTANGSITAYSYGVQIKGAPGTVDNAGVIDAFGNGSSGIGILLAAGGYVSAASGGVIFGGSLGVDLTDGGTIANAGSIGGATYGVDIKGTAGTLTNTGTITGGKTGAVIKRNGSVDNSGLIEGTNEGLYIYGQSFMNITNQSGGTITGARGLETHYTATLDNAGVISGTSGLGMYLAGGGMLTNESTGTISGTDTAIRASFAPQAVLNAGLISSTGADGIDFLAGGTLTNSLTGTITAGLDGVYDHQGTLLFQNDGVIYGGSIGVAFTSLGTISNTGSISGVTGGVSLATGGAITNAMGGTITSPNLGIFATAGTVLLLNAGSVYGGDDAVALSNGTVVNQAGGAITADFIGVYLGSGSVSNNGTITGRYGVYLGLGTVVNGAGGLITGSGAGVIDIVGAVTNAAGGVIQGGQIGVQLGSNQVTTASTASLLNDGTIAGGTDGVVLHGAAVVTNAAGGVISGGDGVEIIGDEATLVNAGTIIGVDGGDAIAIMPAVDPAQITLTTGSTEMGTIDGGGTDGQIFLTGDNTLTNTIADFGAGSALDIAAGADWTATGNWTVANVTNDGTFQPGVIGTALTLSGNFTQSATGVLQVVVTPTAIARFIVDGAVKLAGTLRYGFAPGTYVPGKETFLTATQGITGGFSTIDYLGDVPASLQHATGAVATAATLVLSGMDVDPTPPPTPPTPPKPPAPPMLVTPADDAVYADAPQAAAMAAQDASADLLNHATMGDAGNAACAAASGVARANADATGASMAARMTTAVAAAFCNAGGWVAATGTAMTLDGAGDAASYHTESGGVLAGMDAPVRGTEARLGIAVGYDNADLKDSAGGKVDIGTTRIGLYGTQPVGRFTLAGDFMVGLADDTASRPTGIGTARTKFGGTDYAGGVQIITAGVFRGLTFAPAAGLRIASASDAAFAESRVGVVRDFAVSGDKAGATSIQPYVTLDVSRRFLTPGLVSITPSVSVGYVVEAGSLGKSVTVTAADGTDFTARAATPDASAAQLGAGITAGKGNWSVYARYTAYVAGNWSAQSGEAGLQLRF